MARTVLVTLHVSTLSFVSSEIQMESPTDQSRCGYVSCAFLKQHVLQMGISMCSFRLKELHRVRFGHTGPHQGKI